MKQADEELMELYQAGEISAFNELYARYEGIIFGFLVKRLSHEEALEVFQDVFRKIHEYRFKFDPRFSFKTWAFTIARNTLIDFYRKNKRVELSEFSEESFLVEDEKEAPQYFDAFDLSVLNQDNQKIIKLRYLEGKDFREMAKIYGTNEANMRKKVSRAVLRLKEFWR